MSIQPQEEIVDLGGRSSDPPGLDIDRTTAWMSANVAGHAASLLLRAHCRRKLEFDVSRRGRSRREAHLASASGNRSPRLCTRREPRVQGHDRLARDGRAGAGHDRILRRHSHHGGPLPRHVVRRGVDIEEPGLGGASGGGEVLSSRQAILRCARAHTHLGRCRRGTGGSEWTRQLCRAATREVDASIRSVPCRANPIRS